MHMPTRTPLYMSFCAPLHWAHTFSSAFSPTYASYASYAHLLTHALAKLATCQTRILLSCNFSDSPVHILGFTLS
ncbi:hypothetical protein POVWA1_038240 [Plasmodium ovale wallikeri]|uniref:Uncharacterized protein n=1 Tax=Plasmodium ovale wallikeri TaxID=864142 RepID=A0A1A8Z3N8_PLAOA|nr:hypothetical protein POVWA1_038240 [Plasmodium ovale wallikeri]